MFKHILKITLIIALGFFLLPNIVLAQDPLAVYLTVFYGDGCPHCHDEFLFLEKIQKDFTSLQIRKLEIWSSPANAKLMQQTGAKLNATVAGVPFTVVGDQYISGYFNDEITGARIKGLIEDYSLAGSVDFVGQIINQNNGNTTSNVASNVPEKISLPFLGEIDVKSWSLPVLTIVIAALDSLNPCAMWVLLFLISLLFGMDDRRKMWFLGGAFLFASAASYFLFLAAWLNLFLFIGFIYFIRIGIGVFAIGSGIYYLREWYKTRDGGCHVTDEEKKKKIMNQLRRITEQKVFWLAFIGILALAFLVNLIELVCSAGLPAIYSQILALAKLSSWQYYFYLLLYVFVYILPSLIVFFIAMLTMQAFALSTKIGRLANFFGGIIILLLGILLIFKPAWIMFG